MEIISTFYDRSILSLSGKSCRPQVSLRLITSTANFRVFAGNRKLILPSIGSEGSRVFHFGRCLGVDT